MGDLMSEQNDARFAYDMVSKIFDPLKERMDSQSVIMQRLIDKITEISTNISNINSEISSYSSHPDDFKAWKNRITWMIGIGTLIISTVGGLLIELHINLKELNSAIEPLTVIIKNLKP